MPQVWPVGDMEEEMKLYQMPFYGVTYRAISRILHKLNLHYMPVLPVIDNPSQDRHWCQWCGLRGEKTSPYGMQKAREALSNASDLEVQKGSLPND